jgi:hypothetical protein
MNEYFTVEQLAMIVALLSAEACLLFYFHNLYKQFTIMFTLLKFINKRSAYNTRKLAQIYNKIL